MATRKTSSSPINKPSPPRKKGRPARLSRDQIVHTALDLLTTTEPKDLTLTAIAKQLKTVPMSLYNHIKDMDDIMEGAAELVLADIPRIEETEDDWRALLLRWMDGIHTHLSKYPQAGKILGQNNQVTGAWMGALTPIIRMLRQHGLDGKPLVMTTSWIAEACVSLSLIQTAASIEKQQVNHNRLQLLPERDQHEVYYFMSQMLDLSPDEYYQFIQQRLIDSIELLLETGKKR